MNLETKELTVDPRQWVSKYADYLYNYALTRLNDEDIARDLVQDTFLAALEKIQSFKGESSERTWLTAILKYKVIDIYRKKSATILLKPDVTQAEKEQDNFFNTEDGHWNAEHRPILLGVEDNDPLHNKELAHILQLCMHKLPALWLSVFTMKHVDGENTEMICTSLKLSTSNYWVIIHRAKLNLRACLQRNWS
ncbi:sigma-70 family RNA polymerase sigma factor [Mucilaginibacter sp. RS28]|uniref:Sigma-70 family RNA polymerase sigma factor n=1 Tax=Mucilaginibacter straminoryzae TaxID=2932774 RepID=A0A9X2BAT4_9SPHI|nr:sigma-70 family RNA polymerase sigma factor [Mucilaginibacter straminoryzae]MCJ8209132.1 sigma-70 family RNA polymerase sigma factor [Mucilaginibacter straminoryzae]